MEIIFLIGRIMFAGVFLMFGMMHFKNKKEMIAYVKTKEVGAPALANFMAGLILTVSGVLLILGIFADIALILMVMFLVTVSLVMHDFWNIKDKGKKQDQMIHFMMNMSLAGASLMLLYLTHWPLSL